MAGITSFKDIVRGINTLSENLADIKPSFLHHLAGYLSIGDNFYYKTIRLNKGNLDKAMKDILIEALGQCDTWDEFTRDLQSAMSDCQIPMEYRRILFRYDLQDAFMPN